MIVHCGEALIDFVPGRDGSYTPIPGGSPFNSAIASARLGASSTFFGKISTDFFGDQLWDALGSNGVDRRYVLRSGNPSTLAFVKKTPSGEARYAFFAENAADRDLSILELPDLSSEVSAIHVGSISLIPDPVGATLTELVRREHRERVISFDPNIRPTLIRDASAYRNRVEDIVAGATIVKVSDEDLEWITGDTDLRKGAGTLLSQGATLVVVTRGEAGVLAVKGAQSVEISAVPVTVADTIGAGDSFHAALLVWLELTGRMSKTAIYHLSTEEIREMVTFGSNVAAVTCSRPGADPPGMVELPEGIRI